MKVCFETFGCRLSRSEALEQEAQFLARGWSLTDSHQDADLIVIRGCSVTARAQHDCEKLISHIKEKYPNKRIVVTGCLKEKRNEHWLRDIALKGARRTNLEGDGNMQASVPMRTARAYLKVQDGCSCACSFCIVPQFRGKSVSVDFAAVLEKARSFIAAGYHEIVLTGCNLSMYRSDGKNLADLVKALSELDANCRIRLGSVEPSQVALEIIDLMCEKPNICRYLHLPIQSDSPAILAAMNRPYPFKLVETIAKEAVKKIPLISIGCDLMTGFPGEGELEFLTTNSLFKRFAISRAHIFPYSERPGTPAAVFANSVPREIRHERARTLAQVASTERSHYAKKFLNRVVEVIIEDEKNLAGWTSEYLWCQARSKISANLGLKRKSLVRMKVVEVNEHILLGSPLDGWRND